MNWEKIREEIDIILSNVDANNVTYTNIKQELSKTIEISIIEGFKSEIKDHLMDKVSESLNISMEIPPLEDSDEDNENLTVSATKKKKRGTGGGFQKPVQLSTELADLLGESQLPRSEVTRRLWAYIKINNIQDPTDKRFLLCDEKLENIFKKKRINIFKMNKPLALMMKNIHELQAGSIVQNEENETPKRKKVKTEPVKSKSKSSPVVNSSTKTKVIKKKATPNKTKESSTSSKGGFGTVQVTTELEKVLGVKVLPRTQVIKLLWDYIRLHNLQDPSDRRFILCDEQLTAIFHQSRISMFGMNKPLALLMSKYEEDGADK